MGIRAAVSTNCPAYHPLFSLHLHSFEKRKRKGPHHTTTYHFIGYSSLYPFYYYPEKIRLRLRYGFFFSRYSHSFSTTSVNLWFRPRSNGMGMDVSFLPVYWMTLSSMNLLYLAELYKAIYQYIVGSPHIAELTVEDPAEAFEDLRDKNDLQMLLANERFMEEGFGPDEARKPARKTGRASATGEKNIVPGKWGRPWLKHGQRSGGRI
jgi:histone acetyltransferase 1